MIDPTYFCPGCTRVRCACPPPGYEDHAADEAYQRGYAACVTDGYGEHPLFWPVASGEAEAALALDWRRLCTGGTLTDTDGCRVYGSTVFNARPRPWPWPYRSNPLTGEPDPETYLVGWDDAGAGLPSAVDDPEAHAVHAAALDACEPWALCRQPDLSGVPLGPWPARREPALAGEDDLPF
ncbi:MAG TPA: hypothetical protein EYQ27_02085 [Gemmatimonadetes bacterium]|nr:hypothetical protein [Gemmatimonadota bacterium]